MVDLSINSSKYKNYRERFGQRLRDIRSNVFHESQEAFAKRIGVHKSSLSMYELGERIPDAESILQIAERLGYTTDYLLLNESAPDHDSSFVCEWTGLSGETVEILREVNKVRDSRYSLIVELFEYMLKQYNSMLKQREIIKELKEDHGLKEDTDKAIASEPIDAMMLYASEAMRYSLIKRTQTKYPIELFDDAAIAERYLSEGGFSVIPTEIGYHYALQEASNSFNELLKQFIREKLDTDPDYAKRIWDPSAFSRTVITSLFTKAILSSDPSHNEECKKDTEKEEPHELPVL